MIRFFSFLTFRYLESNLFWSESNETDCLFCCVQNLRPREPSEMRKETPASDWTRQELTSSWLTMYLGSYFDRRYHCERADKLSLGSPWRRCVPPLSCPDSHQAFSTPSSLSTLLGAKACGGLFGWSQGLCWQGLQGSGYHRPLPRPSEPLHDQGTTTHMSVSNFI